MSLLWLLSWWLSNSTVPPPPDWTEALLDLKALWFFCLHYCSRFVKWSNKRIMPGLVGGDGVWKRWSHTQSQRFGSESWFFYDLFSWLTSQFVRKNNSIVKQHQNNNIHDDDVLINKEGIAAFPRESQWSESNVVCQITAMCGSDLFASHQWVTAPPAGWNTDVRIFKKHCTADLQSCFHVSLLQHTWYNDQLVIRRIKHGD